MSTVLQSLQPPVAGWHDNAGAMAALAAVVDRLDFGVHVCDADARVIASNAAARWALDIDGPGIDVGGALVCRHPAATQRLRTTIAEAVQRSSHRLFVPVDPGLPPCLVMPLGHERCHAAVLLWRPRICGDWPIGLLSLAHGLTATEQRVLRALAEGLAPAQIAGRHGVALSTVRTQVGSVRDKLGAESIDGLHLLLGCIPPVRPLGPVGCR